MRSKSLVALQTDFLKRHYRHSHIQIHTLPPSELQITQNRTSRTATCTTAECSRGVAGIRDNEVDRDRVSDSIQGTLKVWAHPLCLYLHLANSEGHSLTQMCVREQWPQHGSFYTPLQLGMHSLIHASAPCAPWEDSGLILSLADSSSSSPTPTCGHSTQNVAAIGFDILAYMGCGVCACSVWPLLAVLAAVPISRFNHLRVFGDARMHSEAENGDARLRSGQHVPYSAPTWTMSRTYGILPHSLHDFYTGQKNHCTSQCDCIRSTHEWGWPSPVSCHWPCIMQQPHDLACAICTAQRYSECG